LDPGYSAHCASLVTSVIPSNFWSRPADGSRVTLRDSLEELSRTQAPQR
jgi:hypothetical protein